MSEVISFRLNPKNPREAEALSILLDWSSQGFSTRHTITEALLILASKKCETIDNRMLADLSCQIKHLIENIEVGPFPELRDDDISSKEKLSDNFVTSILKAAKPGLRQKT